jgi:hypothetical protein
MTTPEEYELHIDAFTPKTIPMARLAEYLRELANLLGHSKSVHFKAVKKGSVKLVATVEREAVPKVRVRVQNARDPQTPDEVRKTYNRIDEMMRSDNAKGTLIRGSTNVIKFPGRDAVRNERMGPFTEPASFDGVVVRVGGTDKTAHALIQTADPIAGVISAECSRELACQLAPHLYQAPVRVSGNARWERNELGEWELLSFRAKEFVELKADDLSAVIQRLRAIDADWRDDANPLAIVRRIRGSEIH